MKNFYVVVENGARFPMKQWLRDNPASIPERLDPTLSTSHALRNALKKMGWKHQSTDTEEFLIHNDTEFIEIPDELNCERTDDSPSFVLEEHLRAFLAENIGTISLFDKKLHLFVNQEGRDGIEYPTL
jgi:hypothetical protein